jgi:hypothetical protein
MSAQRVALLACIVFGIAFLLRANGLAQVPLHGDTELDVSHAWITASIVGCDVKATDKILVNGKAADGINWDNPQIIPAHPMELSPPDKALQALRRLNLKPPMTLPVVSIRLMPGYYRAFSLSIGNCTLQPIPLIAANVYGERRITLIAQQTNQKTTTSTVPGLYGGLPLRDIQVWLVGVGTLNSYVARNEDDTDFFGYHYMYFFDSVAPGRYRLIVKGFGWERDLGEVTMQQAKDATDREITAEELGLKL